MRMVLTVTAIGSTLHRACAGPTRGWTVYGVCIGLIDCTDSLANRPRPTAAAAAVAGA